jgi:acyl transferase domain-containing protein
MNNAPIADGMTGSEIAIIGMSARFPGARDIDAFWRNLCVGEPSITFFSDAECNAAGVDPELLQNPNYVKARGVLEDIELFDAAFFGFSPREAEIRDPQHRLFLECAWEALEQAGYDPETYTGATGVYAGVSPNTYLLHNLLSNPSLVQLAGPMQLNISNDKDFLTTLVSHKLHLRGPSIVVQTACSTSLVATSLACQGLLSYQCDMALAGGVSIKVPHRTGYLYQTGGIYSPDGYCRAFDAKAQGSVEGNGVGVVALKRLADALDDGDHIYAVIKGSAINNDGAQKVSYTAPSVDGQAEVIAMAQAVAGALLHKCSSIPSY